MASKKTPEVVVEEVKESAAVVDDGYVEIPPLFYDKERYSASVYVGYNGKPFLIPRGQYGIRVPKAVKEILDQSEYQKQMAGDYIKQHEGIKNLGDY